MSSQEIKKQLLFPREYYSLKQVAEMLDCTEDDLIHWGSLRYVRLHANLRGQLYGNEIVKNYWPKTRSSYPKSYRGEYKTPMGMFIIPPDHLWYVERDGHYADAADFFSEDEKGNFWHHELSQAIDLQIEYIVIPVWEVDRLLHLSISQAQGEVSDCGYELSKVMQGLYKEGSDPDEVSGTAKALLNSEAQSTREGNLLKMLGGMALLVAEAKLKYKRGDKPNSNQIASDIEKIIEGFPDFNSHGLSLGNIRKTLSTGIKLLERMSP